MPLPVATPQPKRRRIPRLGGVTPLPASTLELAPEPVQEASRALAEALAEFAQARHALTEARSAVEAADAADVQSAAAAVGTDQSTPKPLAPKARADLEDAERRMPAAELAARRAQAVYLTAIREVREEMLAAARDSLDRAAEPALAAVAEVEAALIARIDTVRLVRELTEGYLEGNAVSFSPARRASDRDPLRGPARDGLDALRAALSSEPAGKHRRAAWQ